MSRPKYFALLLIILSFSTAARAQSEPYAPKHGSAERKAIMDALRVPVERKLFKPTVFKVDHLKVQNGWAFMLGVPQQPNGRAMDYRGTEYETAIKQGAFDDGICALLRKQGSKWQVVAFVIGATDVPYIGWDKKYKAPPAIFE
ncbi:MAG TPA: hypothetical protein VNN73_20695 [Blastocatellia bacterium]|nr:hypothetical protein [Blastocatellia bacterium]